MLYKVTYQADKMVGSYQIDADSKKEVLHIFELAKSDPKLVVGRAKHVKVVSIQPVN